jgi:formylglycine-generating enzyme required for sulfatase activity
MVDEVIDFCRTELLWDELLGEVQEVKPRQYARFEPYELVSRPPLIPPSRFKGLPWYWLAGGLLLALIVGGVVVKLLIPTPAPTPEPTESGTPPVHTPASIAGPPKCTFIGDTWTRPTDKMVMVCVPEGEFLMGSHDGDPGAYEIEKPRHMVYLDAFWIDKYEISNTQYGRCVEAGVCDAPRCEQGSPTYGDASKPDHPVQCVDWEEAKTYSAWVGGRLPTEAEWEKACRGTDHQIYPWGNSAPDCSKANYSDCTGDWNVVNPVGSYPEGASPYGALEMAGNLGEWVADWSVADYYSNSPPMNPQGADSGQHRGVRGGSAYQDEGALRCAARGGVTPYFHVTFTGFRVVVPPSP